jgi:hypothetical protein
MGRTTVLITLHGSEQTVLDASARRPILVYQAATSEEELPRIHLPRTLVNKGKKKGRDCYASPLCGSSPHAHRYGHFLGS